MKGILIKEQEIKLLESIYARKAVNFEFIKDFYPNLSFEGVKKKIYRLKKNGFIESEKIPPNDKSSAYFVTKKTFHDYLRKDEQLRIQLKSNSLLHDLDVIRIENIFKKSEKVERIIHENEIQTWDGWFLGEKLDFFKKRKSDLFIKFKGKTRILRAALEYERNLKSETRIKKLLQSYYNNHETDLVFYIFKKENELKIFLNCEKEFFFEESPKIFYQTFDNLFLESEPFVFDRDQKKFNLLRK